MNKEEGDENLYNLKKYKNQIDIWHRTYNINREKITLYYDFLISLHDLIDETFLGVDVLYEENDQRNHFSWCWKRVIENFTKEKIYFKEYGNHYDYFWEFFFESFYLGKIYEKEQNISGYLNKLFDFRYVKSNSELDILTEVYKILTQNLKN